MHDLGTLGGPFIHSEAAALSDPDPSGVTWVVGSSSTGGTNPTTHAVVWCVNGAGDVLSSIDLTPTVSNARASDIRTVDASPAIGDEYILVSGYVSELGNHVVGFCDILSKSGVVTGSKAFVWQNATITDLRSLLGSKDKSN